MLIWSYDEIKRQTEAALAHNRAEHTALVKRGKHGKGIWHDIERLQAALDALNRKPQEG